VFSAFLRRVGRCVHLVQTPGKKKAEAARIEDLRMNPMLEHSYCTVCGTVAKMGAGPKGPSGKGGMVALAGGSIFAGMGTLGIIIGIVLILIGIPMLMLFGLGIIPIALGGMIISVSGTATAVGTTVAATGGSAMSRASNTRAKLAAAPGQCPSCRNVGVIPLSSPMAVKAMADNPALAETVRVASLDVLASLPVVIEAQSSASIQAL